MAPKVVKKKLLVGMRRDSFEKDGSQVSRVFMEAAPPVVVVEAFSRTDAKKILNELSRAKSSKEYKGRVKEKLNYISIPPQELEAHEIHKKVEKLTANHWSCRRANLLSGRGSFSVHTDAGKGGGPYLNGVLTLIESTGPEFLLIFDSVAIGAVVYYPGCSPYPSSVYKEAGYEVRAERIFIKVPLSSFEPITEDDRPCEENINIEIPEFLKGVRRFIIRHKPGKLILFDSTMYHSGYFLNPCDKVLYRRLSFFLERKHGV